MKDENFPHTLTMSTLTNTEMSNFAGNIHGGQLLKLVDEVAYACACRYCGHFCVTLSVDQVFFKKPIKMGQLLTFLASVNFTGTTSMEIGVKVIAEDVTTRTKTHTNSCYVTMVATNEKGETLKVPPYKPISDLEIKRHKQAQQRRELRLEVNRD